MCAVYVCVCVCVCVCMSVWVVCLCRSCLKLCGRLVSYVANGRTTSREEVLLEVCVTINALLAVSMVLFSVWIVSLATGHRMI